MSKPADGVFTQYHDSENDGPTRGAVYPQEHYAPVPGHEHDETNFIPYRGEESHGVEYTSKPDDFDPLKRDAYAYPQVEKVVPVHDESNIQPIPVRVVDDTPLLTSRKKFATGSVPLNNTQLQASMVVGHRQNRGTLRLYNAGTSTVYISPDVSISNPIMGFAVASGQQFEMHTTEAVYAICDPAGSTAVLNWYEEYTVTVRENLFNGRRSK